MTSRFLLGLGALCVLLFTGCGDGADGDGAGGQAGTGGSGGTTGGAELRDLVVETAQGAVQGVENDGVYSYRGIPYAAPPVGELRWAPPSPPPSFADTFDATEPGNICVQEAFGDLEIPGFSPSEDCLFINVDAPAAGTGHPVMVWIHGGAFTLGEGLQADGGTSGDRIARRTDTVVVSMNYRLGQFGFLAHPDLTAEATPNASGNYGLMDQRAALEWVAENIAQFGGDPDNVTLFGESAGAFSVCSHLVSPESEGLFDRAILQSGSCQRAFQTLATGEAQGEAFAEALGCNGDNPLSCMRAATPDEVLAALPPAPNFGFTPTSGTTGSWGPIVDGRVLVEQPADSFESGDFSQVPTIVGFTSGEARLFVWLGEIAEEPLVVTAENYESLVASFLGGDAELAALAVEQYPLDQFSEPAEALAAVATDTIFRCPGKQEAAQISRFVPETYLFQFEYPDARFQLESVLFLLDAELPAYGLDAFHSADIPYFFGYNPLLEIDVTTFSASISPWESGTMDEALWLDTLGYVTRFAATGDPNAAGAAEWPTYAPDSDEHLVLDVPITASSGAADLCETFWNGTSYLSAPLGG